MRARNYPPGASRDALKMVNDSTIDVKYFYSNLAHNGQTRWYEHELPGFHSTWDWTWVNGTPYNHIEFMIQNQALGTWTWITIVYEGPNRLTLWTQFEETIFWTTTNSSQNPNWKDPIWFHETEYVGWRDDFNLHTIIEIDNDPNTHKISVEWCGHKII